MKDDPNPQPQEILRYAGRHPNQDDDLLLNSLEQIAAAQRNLAAQQAVLENRLSRVERNRLFTTFNRIVAAGRRFRWRIRKMLPALPRQQKEFRADYAKWVAHELAAMPSRQQAGAVLETWTQKPKISLVMAVREGKGLQTSLDSLRNQLYHNWELCIAIDRACEPRVQPSIATAGISVRSVTGEALDNAAALNAAAQLATGEYLCFVQESGTLAQLALYYIVEALQQHAPDIIYSDEDTLDTKGRRRAPTFKPDWSPDLLESCMYIGHLLAIRKDRFIAGGGLSSRHAGAPLRDLVLRLSQEPVVVHHIPRVLYHAPDRRLPSPAAFAPQKRPVQEITAVICSRSPHLLRTCLESLRRTAPQTIKQVVVVAHEDSGPDLSLRAVIERAGATIVPFTGTFNFAFMNNLGADSANSPNLLFLNDDVTATAPGWAEMLADQVTRPGVGVAGAALWYPSGVLQHAGIVAGIGDGVGHVGRYMRSSELWPWLLMTHNVSAVTGACLVIRKDLFKELGGLDTNFPNNYNDVDLCFRAREHGFRVVCVAASGLIHAEGQSRAGAFVPFEERFRFYTRWADLLGRPDPYYSPSLCPSEEISLNVNSDQWYRSLLTPRRSGE